LLLLSAVSGVFDYANKIAVLGFGKRRFIAMKRQGDY